MSAITSGADLLGLVTDGVLASLDTLVSKRTGGSNGNPQLLDLRKSWRAGGAAQPAPTVTQWNSLWLHEGVPCHGAAPGGTWANPTRATAGALGQANATGGRQLRLFSAAGLASAVGMLVLYDRLAHVSGLSGTVATAQNVNGGSPGAVTRYTTGERNEIWIELYTAIGATITTITASYTNQSGVGATTQAPTIGGTGRSESGRLIRVPFASGDTGVRDVTSVTLAATTGTAGNFGVTIARPLLYIPIATINGAAAMWFANGPMPEIKADACLAWAFLGASSTAPLLEGALEFLEC